MENIWYSVEQTNGIVRRWCHFALKKWLLWQFLTILKISEEFFEIFEAFESSKADWSTLFGEIIDFD